MKNKIYIIPIAFVIFMCGIDSINAYERLSASPEKNTLRITLNDTSWKNENGTWYCYINNKRVTGWYENEDGWHYFDRYGKLLKGWQTINGKVYYIDSRGIITKGWYQNNEGWHYFNNQGHMLTGWQTINGNVYYINNRGIITKGWYQNNEGWHYFNDQGHMLTGWQTINGNVYYINNRGIITKGWYENSEGWHYFNDQGHMLTGWQNIKGKTYYIKVNGVITTGWYQNNEGWHYFNDQGHMLTGWQNIEGNTYFIGSNGVITTGWYQNHEGWHYFNDLGHMQTGVVIINGIEHNFNANGILTSNIGWLTINNQKTLYGKYGAVYNNVGQKASKLIIDISEHNGTINWQAVKNSGVDGVILRSSWGEATDLSQMDLKFVANVKELNRLGIPYGIYHFSYARDKEAAKREAEYTLKCMRAANAQPKYPVYYDLEYSSYVGNQNAEFYKEISTEYLTVIKNAGYTPGVYADLNYWNNKLSDSYYDQYEKWIAEWNQNDGLAGACHYQKHYRMWQYTSVGKINGISGNVDMNAWFE